MIYLIEFVIYMTLGWNSALDNVGVSTQAVNINMRDCYVSALDLH